jgi:DNA (cytosine-5)-methyltransferase 1
MNRDSRPTVASLFSGAGGLTLGFLRAGYRVVLATDIEPTAQSTFHLSLPEVPFYLGDIRHLTPALVRKMTGRTRVDVVIGGPPCQGFSTLGDQVQADPRNSLFEAFARVISWLKPRAVLMENTSYVRTQYSGQYEKEIARVFSSLGFTLSVETLNSADFGTAQTRKRAFFVGTKDDAQFLWPRPTHAATGTEGLQPYETVGDAIMDLADVGPDSVPNHVSLRHSDRVVLRYQLIPEGGRLPPPQLLPADIRRRNFGNTYKRLHRDRPSLTLVPGNNAFPVHPTKDRSLTAREAARLQGFPDTYQFAGTRAEQCRLVGNAVPVQLAQAIATAMSAHLSGAAHEGRAVGIAIVDKDRSSTMPKRLTPRTTHAKGGTRNNGTAVSLFTGAGGLMLGFVRAGFIVLGSYDRKQVVAENMKLNFPDVRHHHKDLSKVTVREILKDTGGVHPTVVFGGPPCQGFSVFGPRRFKFTRGNDESVDPRNALTLKFISLAVGLEPKVIFMENVKGLRSARRGGKTYLELATARLRRAGYEVSVDVVNASQFGVPQVRERLILVASLPGISVAWPKQKYFDEPKSWQRPLVTVGDVIADLVDASTHDAAFNHLPMEHKKLVVERYKLIPEGGRLPDDRLPVRLRKGYRSDNVRNYSHIFKRLSRFRPATTMVPGHNAFPVHPTLPRTLTVREAARIQTFPDYVRFFGTRQQQCMLVGNAVPPLLAELFAQAIAKAISGLDKLPGYKADIYELKARA